MRIQNIAIAILLFVFGAFIFLGTNTEAMDLGSDIKESKPKQAPSFVVGGGCFWCVESEFRALEGVLYTRSGYAGGHIDNPTYKQITQGNTGHAEVVEVTYDPQIVSYEELLKFFFNNAHDPTQINRQGVDVGPQYRSIAFYENDEQKQTIERIISEIDAADRFDKPIATQVAPEAKFWVAEDYHQQYYEKYQERTGFKHLRVTIKEQKKLKNNKNQ